MLRPPSVRARSGSRSFRDRGFASRSGFLLGGRRIDGDHPIFSPPAPSPVLISFSHPLRARAPNPPDLLTELLTGVEGMNLPEIHSDHVFHLFNVVLDLERAAEPEGRECSTGPRRACTGPSIPRPGGRASARGPPRADSAVLRCAVVSRSDRSPMSYWPQNSRPESVDTSLSKPGWWNGIHGVLKSRWPSGAMWVRVPPRAHFQARQERPGQRSMF